MRKPLLFALLGVMLVAACDTKSPTGPSTVTIETPTPSTTTTSIPPGATTTIATTSSTTTSVPNPATTRTFVSFGPVTPNMPSQLSVILQPLAGRNSTSFLDRVPFIGTQADLLWTVTGFYLTPGGGSGRVSGELTGTLDQGSFAGTLTSQSPECTAEREFAGSVDPQFLRWTGGQTLRDCKGSPLGFNSLVMIATSGPAPTTSIAPTTTTTPLQCSYSLSADGVSVDGAGGQRTVGLSAGPTCGWNVQNFVSWIIVQPTSGSGSATVNLTIEPNPGAPRSATIVIAGLPFVVNQGLPTTTTTTTSTTTSIPALADLLPVTPTGSFCRTTFVDDFFSLVVDVRNQGNAASVSSFTRAYFDNGVSGATFLDRLTPGLPPTITAAVTFAIPSSCRVAACTVLIVADATLAVPESNEANNSVTATCDLRGIVGTALPR